MHTRARRRYSSGLITHARPPIRPGPLGLRSPCQWTVCGTAVRQRTADSTQRTYVANLLRTWADCTGWIRAYSP